MYKYDATVGRMENCIPGGMPPGSPMLPMQAAMDAYNLACTEGSPNLGFAGLGLTYFEPSAFSTFWTWAAAGGANPNLNLQGNLLKTANVDVIISYFAANYNTLGYTAGSLYLDGMGMEPPTNGLAVDQQQVERVTFNSTYIPAVDAVPAQIQLTCAAAIVQEVLGFSDQVYSGGTLAFYGQAVPDEATAQGIVAAVQALGYSASYAYDGSTGSYDISATTTCMDTDNSLLASIGGWDTRLTTPGIPGSYTNTLSGMVFYGENGATVTKETLATDAAAWLVMQYVGTVTNDGVGNVTIAYSSIPGAAQYGGTYSDNVTGATFTLTNGTSGATYAFAQGTDFTIAVGDATSDVQEKVLTAIQGYSGGVFPATSLGTDTIVFSPAIANTELTDFGSITLASGVFSLDGSTTIPGVPYVAASGTTAIDQRTAFEAAYVDNITYINAGEAGVEPTVTVDVQNTNADLTDFGGEVITPYKAANASIVAWLANGNSISYNS